MMIDFYAFFFYLFATALTLSCVRVVHARNPVHAVLALIMAFFNAAGLFILCQAEFIAMILMIVYVGAVAVLFLFVVMMLDVTHDGLKNSLARNRLAIYFTGLLLAAELILFSFCGKWATFSPDTQFDSVTRSLPHTHRLGLVLYTDYFFAFQASGFILLIGMIGAIVLTLRSRTDVKRQNAFTQVSRDARKSITLHKIDIGKGIQ